MGKWLKCNQGAGVILASVFAALLIYIQLSSWAHRELRDRFTLGFFPTLAVALALIFSLIIIFDGRRKDILAGLEQMDIKSSVGIVLAAVVSWVYFAVMRKIGFLIVTPFFLFFAMSFLGLRPWRTVVIAGVVMTVIVYGIFRIMGIELPPGTLAGLLAF